MKTRKVTKALYGKVAMFRLCCPFCKATGLVSDGKYLCCGKSIEFQEGDRLKLRRMCEGSRLRKKPGTMAQRQILCFQNNQCIYCGVDLAAVQIEWDHFVCFAYSWHSGEDNFVAACRDCNHIKSSFLFRNIKEARDYILYQRSRRGLPNFSYEGCEYEFERPGQDLEMAEKPDAEPSEALATGLNGRPQGKP